MLIFIDSGLLISILDHRYQSFWIFVDLLGYLRIARNSLKTLSIQNRGMLRSFQYLCPTLASYKKNKCIAIADPEGEGRGPDPSSVFSKTKITIHI